MTGKETLMSSYATSANAPVKRQTANRRSNVASLPAEEKDRLARVGRLVAPVVRETQNPVSALLATSELLDERMAADDPNRGFVRLIGQETVRVQEALSDLSALAEPMSLNPRAIELPQLVDEALESHQLHAKRRGVRIMHSQSEASLCVWADRAALRLALEKLFKNAIEVMACGGTLRVAIGQAHDIPSPVAQVLVTDDGPRVPPELFARLFEPFVVSPGRRPGMSLALCRMIVERLGGRMNAWNNGKTGLTVEVRLPLP